LITNSNDNSQHPLRQSGACLTSPAVNEVRPGDVKQSVEVRKPAPLHALTGLRCFAAINIVFFHFSDPGKFGFLAPVVNAGYVSVSYFILLSGFVLAYNYAERARAGELDIKRFYEARFTRIYPIYLLSLILSVGNLRAEYASHTHAMFWTGVVLTPLMLQGWIPAIATFLNTPAWTMSAEAAYYVVFPWLAKWKRPERMAPHLAKMFGVWMLGLVPGALYIYFNPDGIPWPDRWSYGVWLWALKYTPYAHFASFVFGVMLASLDQMIARTNPIRLWLGLFGFGAAYVLVSHGAMVPYAIMHDGLMMPLFGCIILGLGGKNLLAAALSWFPLVFVGEASYCLYLLHFNLWNMVHESGAMAWLGLAQFDPWLSYALMIVMALLALHFVEKPAQRVLRGWLHVWR
jgi:peptidoglycan/LPS O-acetylase OafA/YrhL